MPSGILPTKAWLWICVGASELRPHNDLIRRDDLTPFFAHRPRPTLDRVQDQSPLHPPPESGQNTDSTDAGGTQFPTVAVPSIDNCC